jgi:molecular chaperone GrpE (heat shock protein)
MEFSDDDTEEEKDESSG